MSQSDAPGVLEYKRAPTLDAPTGATEPDDQGIVETLVAVTGIKDDVGDVIVPGAFKHTLGDRLPKVCLGHDWNRPIGKVLDIKEYLPGDSRLPKVTAEGKPWPKEAGAVWARYLANLATDDGKAAFHSAKFFGRKESTYSIGYKTVKAHHRNGVRYIERLDLFEFGPVLHPANRLATLQSIKGADPIDVEHADLLASWEAVKSGEPEGMTLQDYSASLASVETKARYVQDATFWGYPRGTLIRPGMKPKGKTSRELRKRGIVPSRNVGVSDKPGDKRRGTNAGNIAISMGDEGLDLGLPDGGLTSDARVRARNPKGKDDEHVSELADYLTPLAGSDGIAREEMAEQRDKALEGLLDEGITPSELREDLAVHPDLANDEADAADVEEIVADYTARYQALAKEQADERSKPTEGGADDEGVGAADKPKPKPPGAKPATGKGDARSREEIRAALTKVRDKAKADAAIQAIDDGVEVVDGPAGSGLFALGGRNGTPWRVTVGMGSHIPPTSASPTAPPLNSRKRAQAWMDALLLVKDADGNPPPYGDSNRKWLKTWRDAEGRPALSAIREVALPDYLAKAGPKVKPTPDPAPDNPPDGFDIPTGGPGNPVNDTPGRVGEESIPSGEYSTDALLKLDRTTGPAAIEKMSLPELERHDRNLTARAAALGKPGVVAPAHKAIKDAIAERGSPTPENPAASESEPDGVPGVLPNGKKPSVKLQGLLGQAVRKSTQRNINREERAAGQKGPITDEGWVVTGHQNTIGRLVQSGLGASTWDGRSVILNERGTRLMAPYLPSSNTPESDAPTEPDAPDLSESASGIDVSKRNVALDKARAAFTYNEVNWVVIDEPALLSAMVEGGVPDPQGAVEFLVRNRDNNSKTHEALLDTMFLTNEELDQEIAEGERDRVAWEARDPATYSDYERRNASILGLVNRLRIGRATAEKQRRGTTSSPRDEGGFEALSDADLAAQLIAAEEALRGLDRNGGAYADAKLRRDALRDETNRRAPAAVPLGPEEKAAYRSRVDSLSDDDLAAERDRLKVDAATATGTARENLRWQATVVIGKQIERSRATASPTAPQPPEGTRTTSGNRTTRIDPETVGDAQDAQDADLGLFEAEDGELEVTPEVADRQDRVDRLLRDADAGRLDLGDKTIDQLTGTRRDLADELRLQEAVRRRDVAAGRDFTPTSPDGNGGTGGTGDDDGQVPVPPTGPRKRPGLAGAAEDYADAIEGGDPVEIERARVRLESSLRRSRTESPAATALAEHVAREGADDPATLRALAEQLREEARNRRNESARARRKVKRLERERLRSLLDQVDQELRGRGVTLPDTDATPPLGPDVRIIGGLPFRQEAVHPDQGEMLTTTLPDGRTGGVSAEGDRWAWFVRGDGVLDDRRGGFDSADAAAADMLANAGDSFGAPRGIPAPNPDPSVPSDDPDMPPEDYAPPPPPVSESLPGLSAMNGGDLHFLWDTVDQVIPRTGDRAVDDARDAEARELIDAEYARRGWTRLDNLPVGEWFTIKLVDGDTEKFHRVRGGYEDVDGNMSTLHYTANQPVERTSEPPPPPPGKDYPAGFPGARARAADALAKRGVSEQARTMLNAVANGAGMLGVQISPDGTLAAVPDGSDWGIIHISTGIVISDEIGSQYDVGRLRMSDKLYDVSKLNIPWTDENALRTRWKDGSRFSSDMVAVYDAMNGHREFEVGGIEFRTNYSTMRELFNGTSTIGTKISVGRGPKGKWGWYGDLQPEGKYEYDTPEEAARAALDKERAMFTDSVDDVGRLGKELDAAKAEYIPLVKRFSKSSVIFITSKNEGALARRDELKQKVKELEYRYKRVRALIPAGQSVPFDPKDYTPAVFGGTAAERKSVVKMFREEILKNLTADQARTLVHIEIAPKNKFKANVAADYNLVTHEIRINKDTLNGSSTDHKRMEAGGWWAATDYDNFLMRTIVHEFGHHMDSNLTPQQRDAMFRELSEEFRRVDPTVTAYISAGESNMFGGSPASQWVTDNKDRIARSDAGQYAAESPFEVIAELWTQYRSRGENASQMAKIVGKHLMGGLDGNPVS